MPIKTASKSRRQLSLLALFAALSAPPARAVGLGDVISQSPIGQPLRIEIRLPGERPDRAEGCIRVIPQKGTAADGIPGVSNASVAIRRSGSTAVAVITDPAPASHPVLRLRLQEICDSNLEREYLVLLSDPPEVTVPARPPAQASAQAAAAPPTALPRPRAPKGYILWTARGGESLAALAARRHPQDPAAQARFIARAKQANPGLFGPAGAGPKTRLAAGTPILLPRKRLTQAAPATLPDQPAATARPAEGPPASKAAAMAPPTTKKGDQLVVEGREAAGQEPLKLARGLSGSATTSLLSEDERDLMRREQKLQATVTEQIAVQADVAQRLRRLEALQAELRAQVTNPPAAAPAPDASSGGPEAPLARRPQPKSSPWPVVLALLGGAGIAAGLWTWRRRPAPGAPPAAPVQKTATPAPDMVPDTPAAPPPDPESVALAWDAFPATSIEPNVAPSLGDDELLAEHDSVIELAEIMLSFGRVHGAAETLAEFIRAHPKQSVAPWVKLLEVYRTADMRPEFEALSLRMNQTFNVVSISWDTFEEAMRRTPARVEDLPHLIEPITRLWGTAEGLHYLDNLLRDNREGTRQGFAIGVADDLLMLISVLDYRLRLEEAEKVRAA
jgi:pilus assembly protein FimV